MHRAEYRSIAYALALSIPQETDTIWVCMFIAKFAETFTEKYANFDSSKFMRLFWDSLVAIEHPVANQV